jgi:hypothetical protein
MPPIRAKPQLVLPLTAGGDVLSVARGPEDLAMVNAIRHVRQFSRIHAFVTDSYRRFLPETAPLTALP